MVSKGKFNRIFPSLIISIVLLTIFIGVYLLNQKNKHLNWSQGIQRIYFLDDKGLVSELTNGTQKKSVYSFVNQNNADYYLIQNPDKIIITKGTEIIVTDKDGKNQKKVFQLPDGTFVYYLRLSQNRKGAILEADYSSPLNKPPILYSVNLDTFEFKQLDEIRSNFDCTDIWKVLWQKDNQHVFISCRDMSKIYKYLSLDVASNQLTLLGTSPGVNRQPITNFVNVQQIVEPNIASLEAVSSNISPIKRRLAKVENGNIIVDGKEIVHWNSYNPDFSPGYVDLHWLPDENHLIAIKNYVGYPSEDITIVEVDTKKTAVIGKGYYVKFFDEKITVPGRLENLLKF